MVRTEQSLVTRKQLEFEKAMRRDHVEWGAYMSHQLTRGGNGVWEDRRTRTGMGIVMLLKRAPKKSKSKNATTIPLLSLLKFPFSCLSIYIYPCVKSTHTVALTPFQLRAKDFESDHATKVR